MNRVVSDSSPKCSSACYNPDVNNAFYNILTLKVIAACTVLDARETWV
jgi:hypothetical protein